MRKLSIYFWRTRFFLSILTEVWRRKREFLASLKAPGYEAPAQAVTEQSKVDVYGDSAVVVGVFRTQVIHKGKSVTRRERFVDTWVNLNHTWKCVASVAVLIPSN